MSEWTDLLDAGITDTRMGEVISGVANTGLAKADVTSNINDMTGLIATTNLFDMNNTFDGYLHSSGVHVPSPSDYDAVSNFIPLVEGQAIAFNSHIRNNSTYSSIQYNSEYETVNVSSNTGIDYEIGVENVAYIRFTVDILSLDSAMINYGTTVEDYTSFGKLVQPSYLLNIQRNVDDLEAYTNTQLGYLQDDLKAESGRFIVGTNLLDLDANMLNYFIARSDTGNFRASDAYEVSDYIPLLEGEVLATQGGVYLKDSFGVYTYNSAKEWVSVHQEASNDTITGQAGSAYIRVTINSSLRDSSQIEHGDTSTTYEKYQIMLDPQYLGADPDELPDRIVLPATMYMVEGSTPSIYLDNIIASTLLQSKRIGIDSVYGYPTGQMLERQWNYTSKVVGTEDLTIINYGQDFSKLDKKVVTFETIDTSLNSGKSIAILSVGDSFADIGIWIAEMKLLLEADGVNTTLIGTKGEDANLNESLSGGTMQNFLIDAYTDSRILTVSGVTTSPSTYYPGSVYSDSNGTEWIFIGGKLSGGAGLLDFAIDSGTVVTDMPTSGTLTKVSGVGDETISYTSWIAANRNPFYNVDTGIALDFTSYISTWAFPDPDVLAIQFTFNDVGNTIANITPTVANAKAVIDAFHTDYPNAKVVYSIEPCGAIHRQGNNTDEYHRAFLLFTEAMLVQFEDDSAYNGFVIIAPSYAFVDLVNGYNYLNTPIVPSSRYPSLTEEYAQDAVHCNDTGMRQIADCIVPCVHKLIL